MFVAQLLVILFAFFCVISQSHKTSNAETVGNDVKLLGIGEVQLEIDDKLVFTVPTSCSGQFRLCYPTSTRFQRRGHAYENAASECDPNNCLLTYTVNSRERSGPFTVGNDKENFEIAFNLNVPNYCKLKTNGFYSFTILQLPECYVTLKDVSLTEKVPEKEKPQEEDSKQTTTNGPVKNDNAKWIIVLGIGIVLSIALLIGVIIFIWRSWRTKPAEKPEHQPQIPEIKVTKSPAPTSPIVAPTSPMPTESPSNVAPSTLKTDAVSPSVVENPTQNIVSRAQKIKKQKKNKKQRGWEVRGVKTLNTTTTNAEDDDSPKYDMAAKLAEDAPRCLHRLDFLEYRGMSPCQSGSQLHPFLQHVDKDYNTFPRRKIAEEEIELFLSITSDAFMMLPGLLKRARQELCRHGAVYTHRRWVSFTAVTRHYLRQITTPGFIAWYGFAGEHGRLVKLKDNKGTEKILAKMSVPALLVVVFREQLRTPIRRKAFAKLRVRLTEVACLHPTNELLGKAYPICLIPEMLKKDAKKFREGANDMAYSTPFEVLKQDAKNKATEEEENTDETQATFSDGKKRDVLGSVEVMGTQTEATVTVKEDLF